MHCFASINILLSMHWLHCLQLVDGWWIWQKFVVKSNNLQFIFISKCFWDKPRDYPEPQNRKNTEQKKKLSAGADYFQYLGMQEHASDESFRYVIDKTWIESESLQNMRGDMRPCHRQNVSWQLTHVGGGHQNPMEPTSPHQQLLPEIGESEGTSREMGSVDMVNSDVMNQAYIQMAERGHFDWKPLRDWEKKLKREKYWQALKD